MRLYNLHTYRPTACVGSAHINAKHTDHLAKYYYNFDMEYELNGGRAWNRKY